MTFRERLRRALAAWAMVTFLCSGVLARQAGTGELRGIVKDQLAGALPGATVTLTSADTQSRTAISDAAGAYGFSNLPPGAYVIVTSLPGFAPVERAVAIEPGATRTLDLIMRVALDQRVEVVASLDDFRRATGLTPVGLTLGAEQLAVLPNDPEMMLQVLRELSATTGRADQVAVYVDGQPVAARLPPKEAIQSIRISTNAFASEFAEPSAGLVEIVTKPAATRFRAEFQATVNDSRLNARNYFDDARRPSRTHGYSGYLGGPIVPRHWSFLAYGGRWERDDRVTVNTTIVNPALAPERFVESVPTPARIDSFSLRTDVVVKSRHVFLLEYARTTEAHRNVGLESGRDLPQRGISRDVDEESARVSAVSVFGGGITSEFRARLRRQTFAEQALTDTPAVLVLDAFNAGGNQAALRQQRRTREASATQIVSYADDLQTIRGGIQVDLLRIHEQRQTNHGGTFIFGTLLDSNGTVIATPFQRYLRTLQQVPGYGPSSFSIARGEPSIDFDDWQVSAFLQDDVPYTTNVTLSGGIRQVLQKRARAYWLDVAPRAGLTWTPAGSSRHVVRGAAGIFYSRLPPEITLDTLRYDGVGVIEVVVDRPPFFHGVPSHLDGVATRPTVRLQDRVHAPVTMSGTASYEWQVTKSLFTSVGYTISRGERLLRSRNVNAPDPVTGIAPDPDRGPMLQFESSGRAVSRELRVTGRRALARVSLFGTYLWRSARSDTDGPYTLPANSHTRQGEYGRAADDERHRAVIGGWIGLPHDVSISSLLTVGSGRPFNITTGLDNDGDLLFLDRPAPGTAGSPGVVTTAAGDFDLQRGGGEAMIPRNAGQGPSQLALNIGVAKTIRFGASGSGSRGSAPFAIVSVSAENVTNRVNFSDFNGVVTSPLFGAANRALNPRRIELTARVGF
jgi:hypothetical protein